MYSNFCRVTATPEEVLLDFGLNTQPFAEGQQHVKADQRIVMTMSRPSGCSRAERDDSAARADFRLIELDVRRRVSVPQPQVAPAAAAGAVGEHQV